MNMSRNKCMIKTMLIIQLQPMVTSWADTVHYASLSPLPLTTVIARCNQSKQSNDMILRRFTRLCLFHVRRLTDTNTSLSNLRPHAKIQFAVSLFSSQSVSRWWRTGTRVPGHTRSRTLKPAYVGHTLAAGENEKWDDIHSCPAYGTLLENNLKLSL